MFHNPLEKKSTLLQFLWLIFFMAAAVFVFSFMYWVTR